MIRLRLAQTIFCACVFACMVSSGTLAALWGVGAFVWAGAVALLAWELSGP